ncbi:DUF1176 domain-containing protein [Acinetobacter qingfengensis]|uniref:DUF1176 domain-containing protein n=1 Tax=Acinetobacter qingfengensis TaxID=1262585 RepID=A0A1E7RFL3_9GAMM|nr:DUF1176 domain-containing protein [Acinetobacter qingfengensis]OEY98027.1 hypothetical protein BJI46_00400 [Acinetobacter qingfengensis]
MKSITITVAVLAGTLLSVQIYAEGLYFQHKDWELACDNTGTCRAAGYQTEDNMDSLASILFTRKAGASTPVTAQAALMMFKDDDVYEIKGKIKLFINGKDYGVINYSSSQSSYILSQTQTQAILRHAEGSQNIEFRHASGINTVSDQGLTAILLKMDEYQHRLDTSGALIRKGNVSEKNVLTAKPLTVIYAKKLPDQDNQSFEPHSQIYQKLKIKLLAAISDKQDCPVLLDADRSFASDKKIYVYDLTPKKALIESVCWTGAYNTGFGYWIINKDWTGAAQLVTTDASGLTDISVTSAQKGRGIGDCWSQDEWVWNGKSFIHGSSATTGMCRGFPGGAWKLNTISSDIK